MIPLVSVFQVLHRASVCFYGSISFTYSRLEILKTHRQHHLYAEYGMLQIPLMNNTMEESFGAQVTCRSGNILCLSSNLLMITLLYSADVFERSTMVVLVHEL
jgi:hypothetical protein